MTADPQIISHIYRRLQNGFCPTVRQVSQTGMNLLATQSAYYKAFDAHLQSLQELAKSGSDVSEDSNRFTSELLTIISAFQQINREEEKLFVNFGHLMTAVNKFSESEKDRLKDLNLKFLKDEKALGKNSKRSGDNAQIQDFYNRELKGAKEQHSQRYAYFAKNYLELLRKQASISKRNSEIAEKQLLESDAADAVKKLDEVVTLNDTVKSNILVTEETRQHDEQPLQTTQVIQRNSVKSLKAEDKSRRSVIDSVKPEESADSRPLTSASRVSSASGIENRSLNQSVNLNSYEQRHSPSPTPRKVLSPEIYKATPILSLVQAEYEAERRQEEADKNKIPRANANGSNRWIKENYDKEREYSDIPRRPEYAPSDHKIYEPTPAVRQNYSNKPNQPPVAAQREEYRATPRYNKPEAPSAQPTFQISDYGRTLVCTQAYIGQGEHQLSLNGGEHVKLIKSGTRGWALIRLSDSRQGWFPTKFLTFP